MFGAPSVLGSKTAKGRLRSDERTVDAHRVIVTKRDTRAYAPTPIPEDTLRRILQAGRMAGSAKTGARLLRTVRRPHPHRGRADRRRHPRGRTRIRRRTRGAEHDARGLERRRRVVSCQHARPGVRPRGPGRARWPPSRHRTGAGIPRARGRTAPVVASPAVRRVRPLGAVVSAFATCPPEPPREGADRRRKRRSPGGRGTTPLQRRDGMQGRR